MITIGDALEGWLDPVGLPPAVTVIRRTARCPLRAGTVLRLDPALRAWVPEGRGDVVILPALIRSGLGKFLTEALPAKQLDLNLRVA